MNSEHILLLQKRELFLLAALEGRESVCIFFDDTDDIFEESRESVLYMLYALSEQGVVTVENGSFKLNKSCKDLLKPIWDAETLLSFMPGRQSCPPICVYPGNGLTILETSNHKAEELRIFALSFDEFEEYLKCCGLFPEVKTYRGMEDTISSGGGSDAECILTVSRICSKTGNILEQCRLVQRGLIYEMLMPACGMDTGQPFHPAAFMELVRQWIIRA